MYIRDNWYVLYVLVDCRRISLQALCLVLNATWQTAKVKCGTCKTWVSRWVHCISPATVIMVVKLLWVLPLYSCVSEASETDFIVKRMLFTFETEVFVLQFCYFHQTNQYTQ
jgi:hypothetical protein